MTCIVGAELMLAYPEQNYNMPLQVKACNAFLRCCFKASSSTANKAEAAVRLMRGMQSPLPLPDMQTFSSVTKCVHSKLHDGVPAYQLLVQLHQQVLLKLHTQFGKAPEAAKVYYAAMAAFNTTDLSTNQCLHTASCIQTMLLMAQNGLPGLSARGCELLLEAVDEYSEDWLRQTFGDAFFDKVEAVFLGDKVLATAADVVPFPSISLPNLVAQQLDTQKAYMDFAEGDMPHFMIPVDAGPTYHIRRSAQQADVDSPEHVDNAQLLEQQYGHLLSKDSKRR